MGTALYTHCYTHSYTPISMQDAGICCVAMRVRGATCGGDAYGGDAYGGDAYGGDAYTRATAVGASMVHGVHLWCMGCIYGAWGASMVHGISL